MECPACYNHFPLEDYTDETPFNCEFCGQLLQLKLDEGTYEGAVKSTLIILDDEDD